MIKSKNRKAPSIGSHFSANRSITLYHGDALDFLKSLPDESISLVVTSPPYNIGKEYEKKIVFEDYLAFHTQIIGQLLRILKKTGSVCWQVGTYKKSDGEIVPLDIPFYQTFKSFGFKLQNRVVWHYRHGLHASTRFSGRYETLLWFTKSSDYVFNLDATRVPALYPGKRFYKGPRKGQPSSNPKGKNPSDVWDVVINDWNSLFWDIPNVKANHPEKTIQPCQFPIELVERCVLALTARGDVVLDPFAGVGSTLLAALIHSRRTAGSEMKGDYVRITKSRITAWYNGTLRKREMGKPIPIPNGNQKVAQVPPEWKRNRPRT